VKCVSGKEKAEDMELKFLEETRGEPGGNGKYNNVLGAAGLESSKKTFLENWELRIWRIYALHNRSGRGERTFWKGKRGM